MKNISVVVALILGCFVAETQSVGAQEMRKIFIRVHEGFSFAGGMALQLPTGVVLGEQLLQPHQTFSFATSLKTNDALLATFWNAHNIEEIIRTEQVLLRCFSVYAPAHADMSEVCTNLRKLNPHIEVAQPAGDVRLQFNPNDARYGDQEYIGRMQVQLAWDETRGNESVLVGLSDSGLRQAHEEFNGNGSVQSKVAINTAEIPNNNIDDDNNGYVDDYRGYNFSYKRDGTSPDSTYNSGGGAAASHGTNVAGIMTARANNSVGIAGIAHGCSIVPIKAVPNATGSVEYGYESIIYAAIRGVKVLNCSWGGANDFNPVEQSIIDFAVARDVAIVVSGGNASSAAGNRTATFYPANYRGVLSVGESTTSDSYDDGSTYGAHVSVCAPGNGALTTDNYANDAYDESFSGTSSASPMAAGVVALVRSKFPELTALQAIEHVRMSGDDISSKNPSLGKYMPPRVNALNAVKLRAPFSTPSVRLLSLTMRNSVGAIVQRPSVGDTIQVEFACKNYLGAATSLSAQIGAIENTQALSFINNEVSIASVARGAEFTLPSFTAIVRSTNYEYIPLRVDFEGQGESSEYTDHSLYNLYIAPTSVTISNDTIAYSVGDNGWLGSDAQDRQKSGVGFVLNSFGNTLYRGGLLASQGASVASATVLDGTSVPSGFSASRVSLAPTYQSVVTDSNAFTPIGLEISQRHRKLHSGATIAVVDVEMRNRTTTGISSVAVGHFFDWDIREGGDSCKVRLFSEGIPSLAGYNGAGELVQRNASDAVAMCAVFTNESDAVVQSAGLDYSYTASNFPSDKKYAALNSGTSIQQATVGDVSAVVGMKFQRLPAGAVKRWKLVFGAATTLESLINQAKNALADTTVSVEESSNTQALQVQPNPATDVLSIQIPEHLNSAATLSIVNMVGEIVHTLQLPQGTELLRIPVHFLPSGVYSIVVQSNNSQLFTTRCLLQR